MDLGYMRDAVILIAIIALVGASAAIALDDFEDDLAANSYAENVTFNGLDGITNSTGYLDTIGTILGVAVLVGLVIGAFSFVRG